MRLNDRATGEDIADFLNDSHLSVRKTEQDEYKLVKMTKNMVSDFLTDEFYTGVYKHGDNISNLNDQYNFLPLMTPDEFIQLGRNISASFDKEFKGRGNVAQRLEYGLLREKVICDFCDRVMTFQRTKIPRGKNKGKWLLSYYCRNKECLRHNDKEAILKYGHKLPKGIRAKYVNAHIEWTLRHLTKNVDEAHRRYIDRIEQDVIIKRETNRRKLINSYLETILKTTDVVEEDLVYREVVLSLRANDNFISVIKLNPPYDLMVDLSENTSWSG